MNHFDLQVNGYFGVDFNADHLDIAAVHSACKQLRTDGVDRILATVITDDLQRMALRLKNLVEIRDTDQEIAKMIVGIHIEGPFISSEQGYVGAHPVEHVLTPCVDTLKRILDSADGLTKMVTLAPECDTDQALTKFLTKHEIVVSAGHTNASLDELSASIDAGLSAFTHLGNGCPRKLDRHDNIIQRVLSMSDRLTIGLIADGVHVPYPALRNYLSIAGLEKSYIVTDAISAAGKGSGTFQLGNRQVIVDETLATWSEDQKHLVGSAITMPRVVDNLKSNLGLSEQQIQQLTCTNPSRLMGVRIKEAK